MQARLATSADSAAIAAIYNQGIEDRVATFETRPRTPEDIKQWFDGIHPVVVMEEDGEVVAFGASSSYSARSCYAGIAEISVYVHHDWRGRGAGKATLAALLDAVERAGFWKVVSRVFVENEASRALLRSLGIREVGIYEKHGQLDGVWRDVVIIERLFPANMA